MSGSEKDGSGSQAVAHHLVSEYWNGERYRDFLATMSDEFFLYTYLEFIQHPDFRFERLTRKVTYTDEVRS